MDQKSQVQLTLDWLFKEYPLAFNAERKQLKIGILHDILAQAITGVPSKNKLNAALKYYTGAFLYKKASVAGATRINLFGQESGVVSAHHENFAKFSIKELDKKSALHSIELKKAKAIAFSASKKCKPKHKISRYVHVEIPAYIPIADRSRTSTRAIMCLKK